MTNEMGFILIGYLFLITIVLSVVIFILLDK